MINKPAKYRIHHHVLLAFTCVSLLMFGDSHAGLSQSEIETITASWKCQWCPYKNEPVKEAEMEVGVGNISNDSFQHGKYTGQDKKGIYFVGNGRYEYKGSDSNYVSVEARDIGLDSRQFGIKGGMQGRYDLELQYSMLPSLNSDTARTPYRGGSNQSLPAGWMQGATTADMTELANSLRDVDIYSERKTIDVGVTYHASPSLSYDLNFEQQTKQGKKTMGLALLTNSVILAVPIDVSTSQGGVKVNYHANRWQGSVGYGFSIFDNAHESVQWDNAYSAPATATDGQAALEPANEMQQVTLDGVYRLSTDSQATIAMALGRMTQNADFLPYTVNGTLAPPPLPRSSLDGEVNIFNTTLRFNSRRNGQWKYFAQYRHNEQANETPRATYDYVIADTALSGTARTNLPYSFREKKLSLQGRYQLNEKRHIRLDYAHAKNDRTYQEVETSSENTLSATYRANVSEAIQWFVRLGASNRKGDKYSPVAEIIPPENILLRKYNLTDRKRNSAAFSLSYLAANNLQLNAFADYANDDYFDSDIGLQESKQTTYLLEIFYLANQSLSMSLDYNVTGVQSEQSGTTWDAEINDRINIIHAAANYELNKYKLQLGVDFTITNAVGRINVSTGNGFPDLKSTRRTFSLSADYSLDERSKIHAFIGYERYDENNWSSEDVVPNTLVTVLALGEVSPSYDIGVFGVSYKRQF